MGGMVDPRAGTPATDADLVDVDALLAAYHDRRAGPRGRRPAGRLRHQRPPRLVAQDLVQRAPHPRHDPGDLRLPRASQGYDGPLFIGRDTHALSEPALAVGARGAARQRRRRAGRQPRRLHADPGGLARDPARQRRPHERRRAWPTGSWSRPRTTRPATAASSTTRPTAARPTPTPRRSIADRANELIRDGLRDVRGSPTCRAPGATTSSRRTSTTCRPVLDLDAIREAGVRIGADPLGGRERRLLGRDRRAAPARPDRGQPGGRPDVAVHDPRLGREDPDGLLLAVRHGVADRPQGRLRRRDRQRRRRRPARHRHARRRADEPQPLPRRRDRLPLRRRAGPAGPTAPGSARRWCRAR